MTFKKGEIVKKIKGKNSWIDCFPIGATLIIYDDYDKCNSYKCIGKTEYGEEICQIVYSDCLQSVGKVSYLNI